MSGYARAHRGRWDHALFKNKQEAAVWAWMTDTARFTAHSFQTRFGIVHLERGQLLVSQRTIAEDFGLGRQQVRRLMESMVIAGMIAENSTHAASRAGTIITIRKYEVYQSDSSDEARPSTQGQPKPQPIANPRPTQDQPTREEREKGKERRKEERPSVSPPEACERDPEAQILTLVPVLEADPVDAAFAEHEQMRRDLNPSARKATLDPDRRKKLAARLVEIGGLGPWRQMLAQIRESPFLRGDTARSGRLVATIDWLLSPVNLRKVQEGNFDDQPTTNQRRHDSGGSNDPAATILAARDRLLAGRPFG